MEKVYNLGNSVGLDQTGTLSSMIWACTVFSHYPCLYGNMHYCLCEVKFLLQYINSYWIVKDL